MGGGMKISAEVFPSKVLLFGEHSIIHGSQALAIPFLTFFGQWKQRQKKDTRLEGLLHYLAQQQFGWLDLTAFKKEVDRGLFFDSNIPTGYGLGSSGALCAAVYDKFGTKTEDPDQLKSYLSQLESFFHGSSSGIDPLVCYLKKPILVNPDKTVTIYPSISEAILSNFFLLDTGLIRKTETYVNYYLSNCENETYFQKILTELIPSTEAAISGIIQNNFEQLFHAFTTISEFQFLNFKQMIPSTLFALWEEGLKSSSFKLKICGAGGGGFLLGITNDFDHLKYNFPSLPIIKLY